MRPVLGIEIYSNETADGIHQAEEKRLDNYSYKLCSPPFYKDGDELPDRPTVHVVVVHKEQDQPHPGGDVDLQHDHGEQQATEYRA